MIDTYKPTKIGKLLYDLTLGWAKFLIKHRWLYYILSCTWGIIMTLVGCFITLILLCCGCKIEKFYWVYFMRIGKCWGGFDSGLMFVRDHKSADSINEHEFGHTFQNTLFGPFALFIAFLPSAFRYWYRELKYYRKGKRPPVKYDDIWFEKSATDVGHLAVEYFKKQI